VDDVLDRLGGELAARDQRIAELEAQLGERDPYAAVDTSGEAPR
jgi:hypothetical protein